MWKALIISGGSVDNTLASDFLSKESVYKERIAVDGGLKIFKQCGKIPTFMVGDFDTIEKTILQEFMQKDVPMHRDIEEKDWTDTQSAIESAIHKGCSEIHVLGATGGRMDHALANLYCLRIGERHGVRIRLYDRQNCIYLSREHEIIRKTEQYGRYISLLPLTEQVTGITLKGLRYPLKDYTMTNDCSLGVSNEIIEDTAEIWKKEGSLLVMETKD